MNKFSVGVAAALAAMAVAAEPAAAQAAGAGVPVPGGANAAAVVGGNRELNAGYNSIVGNADKRNVPVAARPAKLGEITVGSTLRDVEGPTIGTIFSVDSEGAVVASGDARVKVPLIAFGTDGNGLLLGVTAQRFWELRAKGKPSAQ